MVEAKDQGQKFSKLHVWWENFPIFLSVKIFKDVAVCKVFDANLKTVVYK